MHCLFCGEELTDGRRYYCANRPCKDIAREMRHKEQRAAERAQREIENLDRTPATTHARRKGDVLVRSLRMEL